MKITSEKPDIILCMSDQHGADYLGCRDPIAETPVLDSMCREGVTFANAYTPCPLCVPARMSFMSSLLPDRTGVYDNNFTLADTIPCFTHALAAAGYETVLIGRMHFIGENQRHGFMKRMAPDMTPVGWQKPFSSIIQERGKTVKAFSSGGATDLVGAGASIVNEYDRMVTDRAIKYLSEEHEKPQFILIGTFGPHFPYIADEERYCKYMKKVQLPAKFELGSISETVRSHPVIGRKIKDESVTPEIARACLASYYANIEEMDLRIGEIRDAVDRFAARTGRKKIFGYISDHGDTAGERRMYGKQTYYDKSSKIPMIFTGDGIAEGHIVHDAVSLLDVGPTCIDLAGGEMLPDIDGRTLTDYLKDSSGRKNADAQNGEDRMIVSEMVDMVDGKPFASVMLRNDRYKFVCYHHLEDRMSLIDMIEDPVEDNNLIDSLPDERDKFLTYLRKHIDFDRMEKEYLHNTYASKIFKQYEEAAGINDEERWKENSKESRGSLVLTAVDRISNTNKW